MTVFYHADDYGVTYEQSQSILDCYYQGKLNSVSLILNSPSAKQSYRLIEDLVKSGKMRCVAHLNFVEGKSMSENVLHLVNDKGLFNCSFPYLLKAGSGNQKSEIKEELKREVRAQLSAYSKLLGTKKISVDSHQHYHIIPIVWDALWEVIAEDGYEIEYLRIPVDPIKPIKDRKMLGEVNSKNYLKWFVLKELSKHNLRRTKTNFKKTIFFGMFFTCRMDKQVVEKLISDYQKIAENEGADLELMFHPGAVTDSTKLLDGNNKELIDFYGSKYRNIEKETLMSLQ